MKTIKKDELFQNLSRFLQTKGVELKEGVYSQRINRACDVLTDTINTTQKGVRHAKVKVDQKLAQLRQTIHEATAPKSPDATTLKKPATRKPGKKAVPTKAKRSSARRK